MNSKKLKKYGSKKATIFLILGIALFIIGLFFIVIEVMNISKETKNPSNLLTAKANKYATLKTDVLPYLFAEYDTDEKSSKYYFAVDKDKLLYIVYLDYKTYTMMSNMDLEKNPMVLKGKTFNIPSDVKKIAIDVYNDEVKNIITNDNFEDYFGSVYLDVTYKYTGNDYMYIIGFTCIAVGICLFVLWIIYMIRTSKSLKAISKEELDSIAKEIDEGSDDYTAMRLFLTSRYLVDYSCGIRFISYDDMVWIYPYNIYRNGVLCNKSIVIYDSNGKKIETYRLSMLSKKNINIYDKCFEEITSKNDGLIIGFSDDNRREAKAIFKK